VGQEHLLLLAILRFEVPASNGSDAAEVRCQYSGGQVPHGSCMQLFTPSYQQCSCTDPLSSGACGRGVQPYPNFFVAEQYGEEFKYDGVFSQADTMNEWSVFSSMIGLVLA